jgi:hypothetical protein
MERNSPPYKAGDYKGMKKKGNDGTMYESVPHGKYYRWVKVKNSSSSSSSQNIKNILSNENYDSLIDIQKFLQELLKSKRIDYTQSKEAIKLVELLSKMELTTEKKIIKIKKMINNLPTNTIDSFYDWFYENDMSPLVRMINEENDDKYYDENGEVLSKYKTKMEKIKISVDLYKALSETYFD